MEKPFVPLVSYSATYSSVGKSRKSCFLQDSRGWGEKNAIFHAFSHQLLFSTLDTSSYKSMTRKDSLEERSSTWCIWSRRIRDAQVGVVWKKKVKKLYSDGCKWNGSGFKGTWQLFFVSSLLQDPTTFLIYEVLCVAEREPLQYYGRR